MLPLELYECIVDHVEDQQTVLALTRCVPGIAVERLFRAVCIRQRETAPLLHRRLCAPTAPTAAHLVHHLSVETWSVDADVLANLLPLLTHLRTLVVWIGPANFSPEHLEAMFTPPMPTLESLSLRFRPYVKQATYYQFHKGSYYDSTLLALATWPRIPPVLSIVQDTDSAPRPSLRFAQPIVFFRLDPSLARLLHTPSPALTALRIRIPARPVPQPLTHARACASRLTFLDASTSRVSDADIDALLAHLPLRHLVLDACAGTGLPRPDAEWWAALGRRLVLVGVKKAREREKAVRETWEEVYRAHVRRAAAAGAGVGGVQGEAGPGGPEKHEPRRAKRGRRGLASATITLRSRSRSRSPPPPTRAISISPTRSTGPPALPPKVHIIPPLPSLESLSLSAPGASGTWTSAAVQAEARAAFARGWREGMRVLCEARARMGTTFVRLCAEGKGKGKAPSTARFFVFREGEGEGELEGLDEVRPGEEDIFFVQVDGSPPVLCISGPDLSAGGHEPGCGHIVGRELGMECLL